VKIFRLLSVSLVAFSALVAAGVFVFALAVTFAVSFFRDIEISAWTVVTAQIARWFILFMGVYAIHNVLPIAIAHGRTRREFLSAATGFSVVFAFAMAALAWLGHLAEGGVYALMDWRADDHGLPHAYFLMFLVWCAAGMFLAAAFDRWGPGGIFALPFGVAMVVTSSVRIPGTGELPFIRNEMSVFGAGWHVASVCAWVLAVVATWAIARDMPVRTKVM
jgi:hypothetical protein